jgi:hypothetical protein
MGSSNPQLAIGKSRVTPNKRMKLSKPGDLGGRCPVRSRIIRPGFAAYPPCYADTTEGEQVQFSHPCR